jgi:hypothetical protein
MNDKKFRTTVYVDKETKRLLEIVAVITGKNFTEIFNEALITWLNEHKNIKQVSENMEQEIKNIVI